MIKTQTIEYRHGDQLLEGYVAYDDSTTGPRPAILIGHDWSGRLDFPCRKAEELAAAGYVGFALDVFGKGVFGAEGDVEGNSALITPLASDRSFLRGRMRSALEAARSLEQTDPGRVAAMGYCFGGMCVLELARSGADLLGVISVHGIFAPGEVGHEKITAKVLCLHGHDDPMVPPDQVLEFQQEMTAAGVDWQVHVYGGTMHAFTNPQADNPGFGTQYNAIADRRASQTISQFLEELFT